MDNREKKQILIDKIIEMDSASFGRLGELFKYLIMEARIDNDDADEKRHIHNKGMIEAYKMLAITFKMDFGD